jgi:hypothetical protein
MMMRLQPDLDDGRGDEDEPLPPVTASFALVEIDTTCRPSPASKCLRVCRCQRPLNFVVMAAGRSSTQETGLCTLSTLLAPLAGVLSNLSEFGLFHGPQTQCWRGRYFVPDII